MTLSPCSAPFYKILVPTVDTLRYDFLVHHLILAERPVLLVGPVGTGKTSVAQGVLQKLDPQKFNLLTINLSAQVRERWRLDLGHVILWQAKLIARSKGNRLSS